ncbi:MAG: hypothetical protein CMM61_11905 [Rhodospirillaceae bacterium]|nr:hypothetical protein [Rhodospirillaceae bacterium]
MTYRLTLEGDVTRHLIYDPTTSTLIDEGDGNRMVHPAFVTEGPVSWTVPHRVSPTAPGYKKDVRVLKIQMGFRCNYACAYCNQASWNSFLGGAVEDAKLFLRNLDGWFHPTSTDDIRIEFWGGEPFVYWAKLKILGEELRRRFPRARFNVITNGSLLDDEKVDWLIAHRFGVQISHDGPAQTYRNPEDILDDPEKCRLIRRMMAAAGQIEDEEAPPCPNEPDFGLGFGTVLTRWNFSLAAVRRHIEDKLGVPPGSISSNTEEILLPYDDDAMACVPRDEAEHRKALHTLFSEAANGETVPGCNSVRNKIEDFLDSLGKSRPIAALGQKCGMDREDTIAVNLMGEVTTCHNVSAEDAHHNLGNVAGLDAVRLTSARHHQTRDECRACPVVQLCKGSCMFLEGDHWQAACDVSFTYNTAMLAAALYYMTGLTLTRIDALDDGHIRRPGVAAAEVIRLASPHSSKAMETAAHA